MCLFVRCHALYVCVCVCVCVLYVCMWYVFIKSVAQMDSFGVAPDLIFPQHHAGLSIMEVGRDDTARLGDDAHPVCTKAVRKYVERRAILTNHDLLHCQPGFSVQVSLNINKVY